MHRDALLWSSLGILTAERYRAIKEVYGDLREAQKHLGEELLLSLGCRRDTIERVLLKLEEFDEDREAAALEKSGVRFLTLEDPQYPIRLREIADPPVFLYYKGDLDVLGQPCLGVVGTRKMSGYGRRITEEFVPEFVRAGLITVSGLAQGIDAVVAEETIRAGGKTVAVLGHGLGMIFPKSNEKLAKDILAQGGLLLSEFPLSQPPDTYTFPARNRIIAGLTLGTIVLEAPEESGALITAELALEYGREVFAVPGQIFDANYAGCNALLQEGEAKLVTRAADVLTEIGVIAPDTEKRSKYIAKNAAEEAILNVLSTMPQPVDDLVERTKMPPSQISATLTMMELNGAVRNAGNGQWIRL